MTEPGETESGEIGRAMVKTQEGVPALLEFIIQGEISIATFK